MSAYERAIALNLVGTDEQIVAQLQAVTAAPISLAYLMELLNFRGMLRKTDGSGGQERWVGTLQNLKAALVGLGQTEFVTTYELWFSHVTNPRQLTWDTTVPAWAVSFLQMEQNFAGGANMPTVEDFEAVAALGGGRPYFTLTVEQLVAQRATYDAEVAAREAAIAQQTAVDTLYTEWAGYLNSYINIALASGDRNELINAVTETLTTMQTI